MGNFPKSILGIILVITLLNIVLPIHSQLQYPKVRRDEKIVDDYHGTKVKDPYRWLEKPDSERVADFVQAQNELTYTYLSNCQQRKQFRDSLNELWVYPKFGRPEKKGSRYFYFAQQRGGEVLYVQEDKETQPRALIDPQDNGVLAFPSFGVSKDGELVVYREVLAGEGYPRVSGNMRVMNVTTGVPYPDILENVRHYQIAWDKRSRGFFYLNARKVDGSSEEEETPPPPPKYYVYYHKVGTTAESDVLVVDYADFAGAPSFVDMETSEDGQYLLLRARSYSGTERAPKTDSIFYVSNLAKFEESGVTGRVQLIPIVNKQNAPFVKYVTNIGEQFYFRNRIGNKNYNLIEVTLSNPSEQNWRVVIDENPNYILQAATAVDKSKVVLSYTSEKLNSYAELRSLQNGSLIRLFPLEFGELLSFSGNIDNSEVLFRSTKLEGLPDLFYFDATDPKGSMKRLVKQPALSNYDPSQFVTKVVTYPTPSGENIEMILLHRKDLKRDGSAFAFVVEREFDLDFYFRVYFSYMKDFNAIVAFPHLEEDGEGFTDTALEDFIAATEYLVEQGYATSSRIIARGQSTFGLFVASAVNKRPELFGAAVPSLVAFDMLRYDVASNWTGGRGTTEDLEGFQKTYDISPLHNIRKPANESVQYPGIFIPTPNEYPVPLAFKYLAELQYTLGAQANPFLLRMVPEPREALDIGIFARYHVDRETDVRCFLEKTVGLRSV